MSSVTPSRGHVADPARLLAHTLDRAWRGLRQTGPVAVACSGDTTHRLAIVGDGYEAADHDEQAEAVLRAVGGTEPVCTRLVRAVATATPADLWAALRTGEPVLAALPPAHLRVLLARALHREFEDAATAVRDSVAQLGLALLGDPPPATDSLLVKFQMTRELPHWDPGPGPWSDQELVLLHRCTRWTPGDERPHLAHLPRNPIARHAVAVYAAWLLDRTPRVLTDADLRAELSATHRNTKALTALLLEERTVERRRDGTYRVRANPR